MKKRNQLFGKLRKSARGRQSPGPPQVSGTTAPISDPSPTSSHSLPDLLSPPPIPANETTTELLLTGQISISPPNHQMPEFPSEAIVDRSIKEHQSFAASNTVTLSSSSKTKAISRQKVTQAPLPS